jgi:thioredoxin reductase (NADPH)
MSQIESVPVVIIGGGPAGYTSAIYAARAGLAPVCLEGYSSGGQVVRSAEIHNFPGHPDGIPGSELADRIRSQAVRCGARMVMAEAEAVDLSKPPFAIHTSREHYLAEAVIIATGAASRRLGLESETAFEGRGVCYCAICDGPFFAGQAVAVIGGGDVALEEALMMSSIAETVVLVHRRDEFRASAANQAAVLRTPNISVLTPYVVTEILGDQGGVTGIEVRDVDRNSTTRIDVEGVFVAIGHQPATALFTSWLKVDAGAFLITEPDSTATNTPGVFAAGDVADPRYRQAITAAASGCAAALDAERWLSAGRHRLTANSASSSAAAPP